MWALLLLLLLGGSAFAQGVPTAPPGTSNNQPASTEFVMQNTGSSINIAAYGAKCDGNIDDTAAINAAIAAAAVSAAYTNNGPVVVSGSQNGKQLGCLVSSVNATGLNRGTPASPTGNATIEFRDLYLLCSGTGNICFDATGSKMLTLENVKILGSCTTPPEIGVQFVQDANNTQAPFHYVTRAHVDGCFSLAAVYDMGAESIKWSDFIFANSQTTRGPIGSFGSITGTGTTGTYHGVALTGGTGSGALATIVVTAGTVTSVAFTDVADYQGRRYTVGDTLSGSFAGASGFSVQVAAIAPYTLIMDGQNYWRASSAYRSVSTSINTGTSLSMNQFFGGSVRMYGSGRSALWMANNYGTSFFRTYFIGGKTGYCFELFNNTITYPAATVGAAPNALTHLDATCEQQAISGPNQGRASFFITGANATPPINQLFYNSPNEQGTLAVFETDSNITGVTAVGIDWRFNSYQNPLLGPLPVFSDATDWASVSGDVVVPTAAWWNAPLTQAVRLTVGHSVGLQPALNFAPVAQRTPPNLGPGDMKPGAQMHSAYSVARRLWSAYAGPIVRVRNGTSAAVMDVFPDANGDLDVNAINSFLAGATCTFVTVYDQSGYGLDATEANAAGQPPCVLRDAALGNRPSMQLGEAAGKALSTGAQFAMFQLQTGYYTAVINKNATPTGQDRFFAKGSANLQFNSNDNIQFQATFSTSTPQWNDSSPLANGGHIVDLQYSGTLTSNVPTIAVDGTNRTLNSPGVTGTMNSDGATLFVGNNAGNNTGIRGFPGNMSEWIFWSSAPGAATLDAIRRNQAQYYGIAGVK